MYGIRGIYKIVIDGFRKRISILCSHILPTLGRLANPPHASSRSHVQLIRRRQLLLPKWPRITILSGTNSTAACLDLAGPIAWLLF